MQNSTEYFEISYDRKGREPLIDEDMLWSDALDAVYEAASEGCPIEYVRHVKDGKTTDRTQEALEATRNFLWDNCQPITWRENDFIEHHFGLEVARYFRRAA